MATAKTGVAESGVTAPNGMMAAARQTAIPTMVAPEKVRLIRWAILSCVRGDSRVEARLFGNHKKNTAPFWEGGVQPNLELFTA